MYIEFNFYFLVKVLSLQKNGLRKKRDKEVMWVVTPNYYFRSYKRL